MTNSFEKKLAVTSVPSSF